MYTLTNISNWKNLLAFILKRFHASCTKQYILQVLCSLRKKKPNQNSLWIWTSTQYIFIKYNDSQKLQNFKFKRDLTHGKKKMNQIFRMTMCVHLYTQYILYNYKVSWHWIERFRGVALTNCISSIYILDKFLISKHKFQEKEIKSEFSAKMRIYIICHSKLQSSRKCVERFQRCCDDKKRTDRMAGQKHYFLRNSLCLV